MSPGDINYLDEWIREQSFRVAYNDGTKGFIGKKALREAICSSIPVDFGARGYTPEKVRIRLTTLMSEHLTSELVRECDARRIASMAAAGGASSGGMASNGHATSAGAAVGQEVPPKETKGSQPPALAKGKQRAMDSEDRTKPPLRMSSHKTAPPLGVPSPAGPAPKETSERRSPGLGVSDELLESYKRAAAAGVQVFEMAPTDESAVPSLRESSTTTLPRYYIILFISHKFLFRFTHTHTHTPQSATWVISDSLATPITMITI